MANVFPPFKIDIAGAFCVPRALKDVREQYQNGQVSRQILQAVEDAEVRSLVERLELGGMKVVSDGGFRSRDFLESWEGICSKDGRPFSEGSPLEITGRLSLLRHPILEEFAFLDSIVDGGVMKKQHIPSPAEVMTQIIQRVERTQIETVYSDIRLLTDDIASCYKFLLTKLYDAGCRYVQFDGVHSGDNGRYHPAQQPGFARASCRDVCCIPCTDGHAGATAWGRCLFPELRLWRVRP